MAWEHPVIPQETRDAVAKAIARTPVPTQRQLAREFGISVSSVYRIAGENNLADAWEDRREQTEKATAAKAADLSARRLALQADLLDDVQELRTRLFGEVIHLHVVKCGENNEEVEQTTLDAGPSDWRATMGAITSAVRETVGLARLEAETTGTGAASNLLDDFEASLRLARHTREAASRAGDDE